MVEVERYPARHEDLIAKRDGLLRKLRQEGARGVRSAGITRSGGYEQLLLLVSPGCSAGMPKDFEGVRVIVRETAAAKA